MKALADPLVWLWLAVVVAGTVCWRRGRKKWGSIILASALLACVFELTNVPARLLASLERPFIFDKSSPIPPADAVLVLGGYGQPFPQSLSGIELNESGDRLLTGIGLVREGKAAVLVVSGGGRGTPPQPLEAQAAKAWIESWKLLPAPVETLGASRNTHDEALRMKDLAQKKGWNKFILVTSAWHMRRAATTFRKAGLEVIAVGCDYQGSVAVQRERLSFMPRTSSLWLLRLWLEETLGYGFYRVRGWI
jgi:uncharacterized SAM-binding protein YcdF (DUF218 family)